MLYKIISYKVPRRSLQRVFMPMDFEHQDLINTPTPAWEQIPCRSLSEIRDALLGMESQEAVNALAQLYDRLFKNLEVYSESEKEISFQSELQAIMASNVHAENKLRLIRKLTPVLSVQVGIQVILEDGLSTDPLLEKFFLEFAAFFRYRMPPNELSALTHHILFSECNMNYKLQLLSTIIDHCEKQHGHIPPSILEFIRERLLKVEGPYLQPAATILEYLYDLIFKFVGRETTREHAMTEFQAVMQSGPSLDWKLRVLTPIIPWFQDGFGMQFLVDRLVKPDPLTDEEQRFFLGFTRLLNYQIPSEELSNQMNTILQSSHPFQRKIQLLDILTKSIHQIDPVSDSDWHCFLSIREHILQSPCPQSASVLTFLYDSVLLKIPYTPDKAPMFQAELRAVALSTLDNKWKLMMVQKMAPLFHLGFAVDGIWEMQIITDRLSQSNPLTDKEKYFFLKFAACVKCRIRADALNLHIQRILKAPHHQGYLIQLLKTLLDHCKMVFGHLDWKEFIDIRDALLNPPYCEKLLVLYRLHELVLIPQNKRQDENQDYNEALVQSELQALIALNLPNNAEIYLIRRISSFVRSTLKIQLITQRLTNIDPLRNPLNDEEKSFYLIFATSLKYEIPEDEFIHLIRDIFNAYTDLGYKLQLIKALIKGCQTVLGDSNWSHFVNIREELVQYQFPEVVDILEGLYRLILVKDGFRSLEKTSILRAEWLMVFNSKLNNDQKLKLAQALQLSFQSNFWLHVIMEIALRRDPLTDQQGEFLVKCVTLSQYELHGNSLVLYIKNLLCSPQRQPFKLKLLNAITICCKEIVYFGPEDTGLFVEIREKLLHLALPETLSILERLYELFLKALPYAQVLEELPAILLSRRLQYMFKIHLMRKIMLIRPIALNSNFLKQMRMEWNTRRYSEKEWQEIEIHLYSHLASRKEKICYLCSGGAENRYQLLDELFTNANPTMTIHELTFLMQKIQQDPLSNKSKTATALLEKINVQLEEKKRMHCPPYAREKMTVAVRPGLLFSIGN